MQVWWRLKIKTDCFDLFVAGIAVLGLVIVGALILVAVKQTQPREAVETERQRDFTTKATSSTIKTNIFSSTMSTTRDTTSTAQETTSTSQDTMSSTPDTTQPPDDKFQSKLVTLYQLVSQCKEMMDDEKPENKCEDALGLATEENIDYLIEEMQSRIKDADLSKNLASLLDLPQILDKLNTSSNVDSTTYLGIISGLQPVMDESHQIPLNTTNTDPDRRDDGDELDDRDNISSYQTAVEVSCDQGRERRCRDKSACYPREKYCDFEVDCQDNSDEDDCSCVERLIDDRLCDAITDCDGGFDEGDCGCGVGEFFCAPHPTFGPPECVKEEMVCNGVADCSNGRDEEDCYLLGGDVNNLSPGTAASAGYMGVWAFNMSRYLPMGVEDGMGFEVIYARSKLACAGVVGSVPSFELVPATGEYEGMVGVVDDEKGWQGAEMDNQELVFVECGVKLCGTSSARSKRDLDKRIKRDDTYNVTCDERLAKMNDAEQEIFKTSAEYAELCSLGDTDAKIVGGEVSYPDSWPYTVALYRDGQFICGATIVSPEWVVTAGHCVFGYDEGKGFFYQVRAGMVRRQSQSPWQQFRHMVDVFIHPEYDNTYLRHDIALAKLNSPLYINRHVQTICLPHDAAMYPSVGSTCMATGWGDISEDGPSSEELREVQVPILAKCGRSYNNISYQICGGYTEGGKDACQGDSGGPLYCQDYLDNWYLGGVISHGRGCARAEEAGVYVRLAWYMDWVGQVLSGAMVPEGGPRDECGGVMCGSGECVPGKWVCDLTVDCLDGGDVLGCVTLANGTRVQGVEEATETVAGSTSVVGLGGVVSAANGQSTFTMSTVRCTAEEFKCSSLEQCVAGSARCDGVRDCPDWSDERDCLCGEMINMARVCDGVDDCRDQSDEVECELCGEAEWRCPLSGECVQGGAQCNTESDCRWGEDERFCTAFTQGSVLPVSPTGDLIPLSEGMLLINQEQAWKPLCAVKFSNSLASNVCRYMGWPSGVKYDLIDTHDSPLNETVETQVQGRSSSCYHVNIQCEDDNCGARPMYRNLPSSTPAPLSGPGSWPWHANFFNDGEYVCGGSIVHKVFVLTDLSCAKMVVQAGSFITVLVGQEKRTNVGLGPYSQLRIVVSLKVVQGSTVVLAQMDRKLEFNDHVNQLCLSEENWTPSDSCVLSGMAGDMLTKTMETEVEQCSSTELCLTTPSSDVDTLNWAGALACADTKGRYRAVGVYHSTAQSPPGRVTSLLGGGVGGNIARVITAGLASDPRVPDDPCVGVRCGLGNCVKEENICDRNWDCQEGEDEANCPVVSSTRLALCEKVGSGPECSCLPGQLKCGNNLCLDLAAWCDGVPDCGDGSDEPAECAACVTRLALLSPTAVCDSVPDCQDWSDETSQACGCQPDSFRCDQPLNMSSSPSCITATALCDGTPDCPGGTDESPAQCIALSTLDSVQMTALLAPVTTSVGYLKVTRTFFVFFINI